MPAQIEAWPRMRDGSVYYDRSKERNERYYRDAGDPDKPLDTEIVVVGAGHVRRICTCSGEDAARVVAALKAGGLIPQAEYETTAISRDAKLLLRIGGPGARARGLVK